MKIQLSNPPLRLLIRLAAVAGLVFASSASAATTTLFIDFGGAAALGRPTTGADANGNYWNNFASVNDAGLVTSRTDLIDSDNVGTTIDLTLTGDWHVNGGPGTGAIGTIANPDPALLGEFAIGTATEDFYFGSGGTITVSGLTVGQSYNFSMFATRAAADTRHTSYNVTDVNGLHTVTVQTTGTGAGTASNGNNDTIVELMGLVPDASGNLVMTVTGDTANKYISAMSITAVPEPGAPLLACLAGLAFISRRRR